MKNKIEILNIKHLKIYSNLKMASKKKQGANFKVLISDLKSAQKMH